MSSSGVKRGGYGVKLVRGPFVRPAAHPGATDDPDEVVALAEAARLAGRRVAVDLFCGAGGLGLGLQAAGFEVLVGVDSQPDALETHRSLFAGLTLRADLGDDGALDALAALLRRVKPDLIAGGPPCQPFSRAGRSYVRHLLATGHHDPHADKKDLWQSFLAVVVGVRPAAVVMENVPELALSRDMMILRTMVDELEAVDYHVETRIVDAWRHGVPQFRQRLILVAVAHGTGFDWPADVTRRTSVDNAIGDLPPVEGGWRPDGGADGWADYGGASTGFQKRMREGMPAGWGDRVHDHITRPVREDDLEIFGQMDHRTLYSDIDESLRRYRADTFDDKYKRLDGNDLSRSITAHIAKDGYWYIHPHQNRTLTVREAARLQTFPDRVRFAGPPSAQFRQIGNAVPPLLAERLGVAVAGALAAPRPATVATREVSAALADWFRSREVLQVPWLAAPTRWLVVQGDLLLGRARGDLVRSVWPLLEPLREPADTLAAAGRVREIASWIDRSDRGSKLLEVAAWFDRHPDAFNSALTMAAAPHVAAAVADLAARVVGVGDDDPVIVTNGALRPAARFTGQRVDVKNRLSDGRMAVARMVGVEPVSDLAHLGLLELANSLCRPEQPACAECPLRRWCRHHAGDPRLTLF